jgi:hypothetical protein
MQWPDAFGLGLFTASGTQIALDAGMPGVVAVSPLRDLLFRRRLGDGGRPMPRTCPTGSRVLMAAASVGPTLERTCRDT